VVLGLALIVAPWHSPLRTIENGEPLAAGGKGSWPVAHGESVQLQDVGDHPALFAVGELLLAETMLDDTVLKDITSRR
jgi:hypothetical protein